MRLIDADSLIEKVNEEKPIGRFTLVEYLKNAPTIELDKLFIVRARQNGKLARMITEAFTGETPEANK